MSRTLAPIPADLAPGAILRNGATVIESAWISTCGQEDRFVVLALIPAQGFYGGEYATWEAASGDFTYSGHYTPSVSEAFDEYRERVAGK